MPRINGEYVFKLDEQGFVARKKNEAKNKKVQNVETGQIFESVKAANAYYGRRQTNISAVCRGERRTALGYHWRYTDDD